MTPHSASEPYTLETVLSVLFSGSDDYAAAALEDVVSLTELISDRCTAEHTLEAPGPVGEVAYLAARLARLAAVLRAQSRSRPGPGRPEARP